ncbi:hypothetical protein Bca4012_012514 [Brassica carinata]
MVTGKQISVARKSHAEVGRDVTILSDYYLPACADPGQLICTVLLTGPNYEHWAKYMRNALKAKKNKLGFIDGLVTRPSSGGEEIKLWSVVNSMLFNTTFGGLKLLWDDLDDFEPVPVCCCCGGQSSCAFLMGLDGARFGTTRSNILCMTPPPPSLDSAFSMMSGPPPNRGGHNVFTCTYCGRIGNEEKTCYQLHGFPSDSGRGRGGRGRGSNNGRGGGRANGLHGNVEQPANGIIGEQTPTKESELQSSIPVIINHNNNNGSRDQPKNPSEIIELSDDDGETLDPRVVEHVHQVMSYDKENAYWLYKDPHGYIQGPFSLTQLKAWNDAGYFNINFKVTTRKNSERACSLAPSNKKKKKQEAFTKKKKFIFV